MTPLSAFLLERGAAEAADVEEAVERQALWGGDVGTLLLGQGCIDEAQLLALLSDYYGLPLGPAGRLPPLPEELQQAVPPAALQQYRVVPLGTARGELHVATAHPLARSTERQLAAVSGKSLRPVVVTAMRLDEALWRYSSVPLPPHVREALARVDGPDSVVGPPSAYQHEDVPTPPRPYRLMRIRAEDSKIVPVDPEASQSLLSPSPYFGGGYEDYGDPEDLGYEEVTDVVPVEEAAPGMVAVDLIVDEPTWDESASGWDDTELHEVESLRSAHGFSAAAASADSAPLGAEDDTPKQPAAATGPADTVEETETAPEPISAGPDLEVELADAHEVLEPDQLAELEQAAVEPAAEEEITEEELVAAVTDREAVEPAHHPHPEEQWLGHRELEPPEDVAAVPLARIRLAQRAVVPVREEVFAPRQRPDPRAEPLEADIPTEGDEADAAEEEPDEERIVDEEAIAEGEEAAIPLDAAGVVVGDMPSDRPPEDDQILHLPAHDSDGPVRGPNSIRAEMAAQLREHDHATGDEPESVRAFRHRGPFPRAVADAAVAGAANVNELLEIFVRFARQYFERVALVVVQRGRAEVRMARNFPSELEASEVDLSEPSLLQRAHDEVQTIVDTPNADGLDAVLRRGVRSIADFKACAIPVRVRKRVVALVYADDAPVDVDPEAVVQVGSFAIAIGNALALHILRRKRS
ncbi:MAG: hypothetical protein JRI23_26235 [Deltaproteobacteria bacterium]|jgi:hypothetical protein|nr:hypothetical protein [Deltaproteobacteria bacterium]MBW2535531.1 hypothetical protein [Deltaproteobacteria bacterium]